MLIEMFVWLLLYFFSSHNNLRLIVVVMLKCFFLINWLISPIVPLVINQLKIGIDETFFQLLSVVLTK